MSSGNLLSIIIPTYNMATLLPRCLDTLVHSVGSEQYLEAIVVNDGSKDNSLEVANDWRQKYPDIITVIDKPNGNYGSTINAALPVAKGKYVKVLDSDDWFDTTVLSEFIAKLQSLDEEGVTVDMFETHFTQRGANGQYEVIRYNTMGREPFVYEKVYEMDEVLSSGYIRQFLMHAITYRTQFLKDIDYHQTEGISYTDTEWASLPIYHVKTIMFLDMNLYQYNLDREGQTMDPKVIMRSISQMQMVLDSLISYYDTHVELLSAPRKAYMKKFIEHRLRLFYKLYLLDMPRSNFEKENLIKVDQQYASFIEKWQLSFDLYPENKLLRIDYIKYWHKYHKRWPVWLERFNHGLDIVIKWLYVRIFRR